MGYMLSNYMKGISVKSIPAHQLTDHIFDQSDSIIIDVREKDEFAQWSLKQAINIPLGQLLDNVDSIPRDKRILLICASGNRSNYGCQVLQQLGYDAINIDGGMKAWGAAYDTAQVNFDDLTIIQIRRLGKGCLSYLIVSSNEIFVVDPSIHVDKYLELAQIINKPITKIFDTHLHADHLSGARFLSFATDAKLYLNPLDTYHFEFTPLQDNQVFSVKGGSFISISTIRTPGHTNGSVIFNINDKVLLTGNTVFVDGIGRPDLASKAREFAENLYDSLHGKLLKFPGDTLILPAHYGSDTILRKNEVVNITLDELKLKIKELDYQKQEFIEWISSKVSQRPNHYEHIIKSNMGLGEIPLEVLVNLELGPNRCSA